MESQKLEKEGKTVIYIAMEGRVEAMMAIQDEIREESKKVVEYLTEKMGIECHMVTGDNKKTAKTIAKRLGIENVSAQVLPQDKLQIVKQLQHLGSVVAMVGDGINDSPALIQSDLGSTFFFTHFFLKFR